MAEASVPDGRPGVTAITRPPAHYILVIVNAQEGVPSVARIVKLNYPGGVARVSAASTRPCFFPRAARASSRSRAER
jgi:hypothetical protein